MPHWMVHQQHGVMPVYSMSEVTQVQAHGWTLLNTGESPDLPPKRSAAQDAQRLAEYQSAIAAELPAPEAPAQAPGGPEAPVSEPAAPPMPPEPQRSGNRLLTPDEFTASLKPVVDKFNAEVAALPVKRKPGRPPKVK